MAVSTTAKEPVMKTSLAVLASATLALTACSASDEPAQETTVTKTATPEAATEDGPEDVAPADADGNHAPVELPDLPTFDSVSDAYGTFEDGYLDTEDKDADWSCSGGGAEEHSVRDPDTGEVFDGEVETCWIAKTNESLTIHTVEGDPEENMHAVLTICDEFESGEYGCFPGEGWAVITENEAMMGDVLEGLGVDKSDWGY